MGIWWNPITDKFEFKTKFPETNKPLTKRRFISEASTLYDPFGWLSPITIKIKILMQQTWKEEIGWHQNVSVEIKKSWKKIKEELPLIEQIKIDRWTKYHKNDVFELYGFCDASEDAYATVIYIKVIKNNGMATTTFLASKTKVAPVQKISLPTKLMTQTKNALRDITLKTYFWTNSTITLAWIRGDANRRKTFVENRVTKIHNCSNLMNWHHVSNADNPADSTSRGLNPSQLITHTLWWTGPQFLKTATASITTKILNNDLKNPD